MGMLARTVCFGSITMSVLGVFVACSSDDKPPISTPGASTRDGSASPTVDAPTSPTTTSTVTPTKCFKDDEADMPKCAWKGMSNGEKVTITAYPADDAGSPVALEMTAVVPSVLTSIDDCKKATPGFILKKAGMTESDQPDEGVYWKLIAKDGTWTSAGNGGVSGMVVALDPAPVTDSGVPRSPDYAMSNHCDDFYKASTSVALVSLVTVIHDIKIGGTKYEADFVAQHAKTSTLPSGYYVTLVR